MVTASGVNGPHQQTQPTMQQGLPKSERYRCSPAAVTVLAAAVAAVLAEGFNLPMARQLLTAVADQLPKLPAHVHKAVAHQ
jgi:hypothetical protein